MSVLKHWGAQKSPVNDVNLPQSPTSTIGSAVESIMTMPNSPVPDVANTFQSTPIPEVGSTAAQEIMSTSAVDMVNASLSGRVSPDIVSAAMDYMEPSSFYFNSL